MKTKEAKPITNGKAKSKQTGVRIVTPGNGGGPFCGRGTKVIDLKTGKEIENVREIHVHILPDEVVYAEIILLPSEVEVAGAEAEITKAGIAPPGTLLRSDVLRFFRREASPAFLERFERAFPKGLIETTTLADRWRRFKHWWHREPDRDGYNPPPKGRRPKPPPAPPRKEGSHRC